MPTVVSDTSCMIDLWNANLLCALLRLPYSFVMPYELFMDELLSLSTSEKTDIIDAGLEVRVLDAHQFDLAICFASQYVRLNQNDCLVLALSKETHNCILLTGDASLRAIAEEKGIEVRGVLWAIDQIAARGLAPAAKICSVLRQFLDDSRVFLPKEGWLSRLRRLEQRV